MFKQPVIFTTFCGPGTSSMYVAVPDMVKLKTVLDTKLQEFNESNAMMDLVLFDQAMVRHRDPVMYVCDFTFPGITRAIVTESVVYWTRALAPFFLSRVGYSAPYADRLHPTFIKICFTLAERFLILINALFRRSSQ